MRLNAINEFRLLGAALVALGLSLGLTTALAARLALTHMVGLGAICGDPAAHCVWCAVTPLAGVAAAAVTLAGLRAWRHPGAAAPFSAA